MKIEELRFDLEEEYTQFLLEQHSSLLYYSVKFKNLLKELLGCRDSYLLATEDGKIRGILPLMYTESDRGRVYNSLPYYGSNGGILANDDSAYSGLIGAYNEIACSESSVASTLIGNPFCQQDFSAIRYNFTDHRIGQLTKLVCENDPWDEIMRKIDASARRNVKKALREGVTVDVDHVQMDRLREMHQDNIRTIGGLPKTDAFFSLITRHFVPCQDFDLYVAKKDGDVIACLLLFYFNQTVEYYTPAVDHEYRSIQPLSLILMTAMSDAARRGFVWWNWGGTWTSQTGVYRFKKKWGAIEKPYSYYTQLNDPSLLDGSAAQLLEAFPNFFVVPFSELH